MDINLPKVLPLEVLPEACVMRVMSYNTHVGNPPSFPAIAPERTRDYILFTPRERFEVLRLAAVPEIYASDHLPLIAELALK